MVNVTLAVPADMKHKMDGFVEINWSAVAREAFDQKIRDLELIKKFKSDSIMTEADAIRMGRELNQRMAKRRHSN
mgnify:FL=1